MGWTVSRSPCCYFRPRPVYVLLKISFIILLDAKWDEFLGMAMMDNHGAEGAYTFEEYCSSKGGMEGTGLTGYPKGKGKGKGNGIHND
jgi:hypothetical protein